MRFSKNLKLRLECISLNVSMNKRGNVFFCVPMSHFQFFSYLLCFIGNVCIFISTFCLPLRLFMPEWSVSCRNRRFNEFQGDTSFQEQKLGKEQNTSACILIWPLVRTSLRAQDDRQSLHNIHLFSGGFYFQFDCV